MERALRELYFGHLSFIEEIPTTEEYMIYNQEYKNIQAEFEKTLSEESIELYDKFLSARNLLSSAECEAAFEQGFRIGTKIMAEAFN